MKGQLNGLVAEFAEQEALIAAVRRVHEAGYRAIDAHTPFPVEEVAEALDFHKTYVPLVVLAGGLIGGISGFVMQYWLSVYGYPLNVGGRPLNSWPAFIPITFETTVLVAALFAVLGMFALNGLPMPYHPLFNVPAFARASQDRYFLYIEASDPHFDYAATRTLLEECAPQGVYDVPA